jgi:hypothetical protein
MKLTIENASQFRDEFRQCGRADQFSYEALGLLFDYLEDIDPDHDLDVIALCCEYAEDSIEQIADWYGLEFSSIEEGDTDGERDHVLAYLNDHTSVVGVTPSGIVYAQF